MGQKIVKVPVVFEHVSYISPISRKHWKLFLRQAAEYVRPKSEAIFEVDEENQRIAIRRQSMPLKGL